MIDWVHKESVTQANVCDTCGHKYSDVCGTCESLDGVPVQYSPTYSEPRKITNADRIRHMTDEEIIHFFASETGFLCPVPKECGDESCVECFGE